MQQQDDAAAAAAAAAAATTAAAAPPPPQPQVVVDAVTRAQAALSDFVFLAYNAAGALQRDARPLPVAGENPNSVAPAAGAAPGLPPTEEQARAAAAQLASAASDLREAVRALPGGEDAGASAEEAEAAGAVAEAAAAAARLCRARRSAARRVEGGGQELYRCLADAELARRADERDEEAEREE